MSQLNNQTYEALDKAENMIIGVLRNHALIDTVIEEEITDGINELREDSSLVNDTPLLTEDEQDILNAYLEDGDIMTAMGNSDFFEIYKKLVGNNRSTKYCDENGMSRVFS